MCAAVFERDAGSVHKVLDRAGDEHLLSVGQRSDSGSDVDGDPTDVVAAYLTLAGVKARSDVDPQPRDALVERGGTTYGARWPIEGRKETVAGVLDFSALEPGDLFTRHLVVASKQFAPASIAEFGGAPCRIHDVGEHHRGQHAVGRSLVSVAGEELLGRAGDRFDVAGTGPMIDAIEFDEPRIG